MPNIITIKGLEHCDQKSDGYCFIYIFMKSAIIQAVPYFFALVQMKNEHND